MEISDTRYFPVDALEEVNWLKIASQIPCSFAS